MDKAETMLEKLARLQNEVEGTRQNNRRTLDKGAR